MIKLKEKATKVIGYHGGGKYLQPDTIIKNDRYRTGLFFSSDKKTAEVFGKFITKCEIEFKSPFIVDAVEEYYSEIKTPQEMKEQGFTFLETVSTDLIAEYAFKSNKYDGVIIYNVFEGNGNTETSQIFIVFDIKNIKSFEEDGTSNRIYGRLE